MVLIAARYCASRGGQHHEHSTSQPESLVQAWLYSCCHDMPHLALPSEPSTSTSNAKLPRASPSESRLACLCTLLGRLRVLIPVRCPAEQQAAAESASLLVHPARLPPESVPW